MVLCIGCPEARLRAASSWWEKADQALLPLLPRIASRAGMAQVSPPPSFLGAEAQVCTGSSPVPSCGRRAEVNGGEAAQEEGLESQA